METISSFQYVHKQSECGSSSPSLIFVGDHGIINRAKEGRAQMDDIRAQIKSLSQRIKLGMADSNRGSREERRRILSRVGSFQALTRFTTPAEVQGLTGGRTILVTDGSINSWPPSSPWPYQIFILRALTTDPRTVKRDVERKRVYSPLADYLLSRGETPEEIRFRARKDTERILATLEVETAYEALHQHRPYMLWMDGPLVRLELQARQQFAKLREAALREGILLIGVIENIDSSSISYLLGDQAPPFMQNKKDRDILWDTLAVGEAFCLRAPAKGLPRDAEEKGSPIRTWFLRTTWAKGPIGIDILEEQVTLAEELRVGDLIQSLTEPAGRGVPSLMDYVDRRVKIPDNEMLLYINDLDPEVFELLEPKRALRPR